MNVVFMASYIVSSTEGVALSREHQRKAPATIRDASEARISILPFSPTPNVERVCHNTGSGPIAL